MSSTNTAKKTDSKVECIIPILNVRNVPASIDYYVNVLGFKLDWGWNDPPDFAGISRGDYAIMLCENGQGHPGTWLWMGVENADEFYEEYKASGAIIRDEPINYPWAYELRVEDLDGHVLRIGSEPRGDESHNH